MNVLVVGANGQIGKHLITILKESNKHTPIAFVRKEEQQKEFEKDGVEARLGNLEDTVDSIKEQLDDVEAIVYTAGSGGSTGYDKTLLIDLDGAVKVIEAAKEKEIDRFLIVSAMQANKRENWNKEMKPYYVAKHYADRMLEESGLTFTIVRPGGLLNDAGTGKVDLSSNDQGEPRTISREDVAKVVFHSIENENTFNKGFDLASGEIEIEEALNQL